jgi:hypothetical protein
VPHHDTLHELIANHRKAKNVPITKEYMYDMTNHDNNHTLVGLHVALTFHVSG